MIFASLINLLAGLFNVGVFFYTTQSPINLILGVLNLALAFFILAVR